MQSTKGASPPREFASSIADAIQAVLRDVRRQVEMHSPDSSGLASLQAPLRRGNALVADLRAYAGVQRLTAADVEILPLLCSFADALSGVLDRGIQITTDVDRQCWPVRVDADGLEEALLKLVMNARDAMTGGGRLLLHARNGAFDDGTPAVELAVIDSGAGMPPEVVEAALRPFMTTRVDDPLAGMGLAAVEGFARQSGGSLALHSWAGVGTHAVLKLPATPSGSTSRSGD